MWVFYCLSFQILSCISSSPYHSTPNITLLESLALVERRDNPVGVALPDDLTDTANLANILVLEASESGNLERH